MSLFFAGLALIVVAALALAVALLRTERVSEQGLADLNRVLTAGRAHEHPGRLVEERLAPDQGLPTRKQLKQLRRDFVTAWAVCRVLGPIDQAAAPARGTCGSWLSFHRPFAALWLKTYLGRSSHAASQMDRLIALFGDQRQRAAELMQIDAK